MHNRDGISSNLKLPFPPIPIDSIPIPVNSAQIFSHFHVTHGPRQFPSFLITFTVRLSHYGVVLKRAKLDHEYVTDSEPEDYSLYQMFVTNFRMHITLLCCRAFVTACRLSSVVCL